MSSIQHFMAYIIECMKINPLCTSIDNEGHNVMGTIYYKFFLGSFIII